MKFLFLLLRFTLVALLGSCASNATLRERRIESNTAVYENMSTDDQALVTAGKVREGFSKEMVFLSWGRPDDLRQGSKKGVPYETWTYTGNQPVSQSSISIGFGHGYGYGYYPYRSPYRSRYYHNQSYFGFYPSVGTTYRRVRVGQVEFLNDRVVSWETR